MRKFKMLSSVHKTYEQQGEIFFCCRNYAHQSERTRRKIEDLCRRAGGEYSDALFAYLTTGVSWQAAAERYHVSYETLNRIRKRFYDMWN